MFNIFERSTTAPNFKNRFWPRSSCQMRHGIWKHVFIVTTTQQKRVFAGRRVHIFGYPKRERTASVGFVLIIVMERASKHKAWAELSRATLGLSFSSPRASKIKLFKPDNSKNQAFQAWPKRYFIQVFLQLKDLIWFLFLQLKWFLFNQNKKNLLLFKILFKPKKSSFSGQKKFQLSQIKPADFFGSSFSSNNKKIRLAPT
jgi:hypothetical protein